MALAVKVRKSLRFPPDASRPELRSGAFAPGAAELIFLTSYPQNWWPPQKLDGQ
jgi:hypothetical protein